MSTSAEKEHVTWNMVTDEIKLSKLQIRGLLANLAAEEPPAGEPVPSELLVPLLVAELLENIRLTAEQRSLIIAETKIAQNDAATGKMAQLCLVDGAYCVATGLTGFIDLTSGDLITGHLPIPPMETISYNLNELYRRGTQRILNRSTPNADRQTIGAGNMEKPADVRAGAVDPISG